MIDLQVVQEEFTKFVDEYERIEKISLKEKHTKNVAALSYKISEWFVENKNNEKLVKQAGGKENFINLATTIGWLHDIGRFEQAKIYNNFNDIETFDHALFGTELLKKDNYISKYCDDKKLYNTIITAVFNHNKFEIQKGLNEFDLTQCKIIRDADKLDILKIQAESLKNMKKEEETNRKTSSKIIKDLISQKIVNVKDRKTILDDYLLYLGFVYDINYLISFEILQQGNYIDSIINTMLELVTDEEKLEIETIRKVINKYIEKKINKKCEGNYRI